MKHFIYLFLFIVVDANSQNSIFIKTGNNLTDFSYTNDFGTKASNISSEFGSSYSVGYSKNLKYKLNKLPIIYDSEISFDELNASVFNKNLQVHWKTIFVGVNNSLLLQLLNSKKTKLDLNLGANVSTMIYGRQEIGGEIFNLINTDSFKGIFIGGNLGIKVKYFASDFVGLSLGYDYLYRFNSTLAFNSDSSEKFSISTNRVLLGVILNLKYIAQ